MESEVYAVELFGLLPEKINQLLMEDHLDNLASGAVKMASLPKESEDLIYYELTDLLVGKIDLERFKNNLTSITKSPKDALIVYQYLWQKLLGQITTELNLSQGIYQKKLAEKTTPIKQFSSVKNDGSQNIMDYIKSQAEQIQKKTSPNKDKDVEEEKILEKNSNDEEVSYHEKTLESNKLQQSQSLVKKTISKEYPPEKPSLSQINEDSIVESEKPESKISAIEEKTTQKKPSETVEYPLKNLITQQQRKEIKLSEYYKNLKNNMSDSFEQNNSNNSNIFQPPFKAKRGGAMIESSFGDSSFDDDQPELKETSTENTLKDPIKYNSIDINRPLKKDSADDIKTDDKFIDLGDSF